MLNSKQHQDKFVNKILNNKPSGFFIDFGA